MNDQPTPAQREDASASETPAELRKRILFLSLLLGAMLGIGGYLVIKAVQQDNFALLAVLILLVVTAIPLFKALRRLRKQYQSML